MTGPVTDQRVGLVLGAGGSPGGAWIRGSLQGLERTTGFRPAHASRLVGTSIGAFISARVGPPEPLPHPTFEALAGRAEIPARPSTTDRGLSGARLLGGKAICLVKPRGRTDSRDWVEEINPQTHAAVVSAQCRPPKRRVAAVSEAADPVAEIGASGAVPLGALPVELDGQHHIDGAVWSVTNADLAPPDQLDLLIVIAPLVATDGGTLVSRLGRRQLATELHPWHRAAKPVLVLAPSGAVYRTRADRDQHHQAAIELASGSAV